MRVVRDGTIKFLITFGAALAVMSVFGAVRYLLH
jgi:hypothetical protein